jgi:hypothetical protein
MIRQAKKSTLNQRKGKNTLLSILIIQSIGGLFILAKPVYSLEWEPVEGWSFGAGVKYGFLFLGFAVDAEIPLYSGIAINPSVGRGAGFGDYLSEILGAHLFLLARTRIGKRIVVKPKLGICTFTYGRTTKCFLTGGTGIDLVITKKLSLTTEILYPCFLVGIRLGVGN